MLMTAEFIIRSDTARRRRENVAHCRLLIADAEYERNTICCGAQRAARLMFMLTAAYDATRAYDC